MFRFIVISTFSAPSCWFSKVKILKADPLAFEPYLVGQYAIFRHTSRPITRNSVKTGQCPGRTAKILIKIRKALQLGAREEIARNPPETICKTKCAIGYRQTNTILITFRARSVLNMLVSQSKLTAFIQTITVPKRPTQDKSCLNALMCVARSSFSGLDFQQAHFLTGIANGQFEMAHTRIGEPPRQAVEGVIKHIAQRQSANLYRSRFWKPASLAAAKSVLSFSPSSRFSTLSNELAAIGAASASSSK